MLGIKDRDTFPLIFLRENCADMAITDEDIAEDFIAPEQGAAHHRHALLDRVHRRHHRSGRSTARAANDVRTILDIDYRPVLWGLTKRGDGETRFVQSERSPRTCRASCRKIDLAIGTIEEFNIAGGLAPTSSRRSRRCAGSRRATLVVKRGPMGCAVIDGAIPRSLDEAFNGKGVTVEVLNVLGAGDAFNGGFLSGWVRGEDYDACTRYANACGALVVSRHGCAPAMPTRVELDYFIANADRIPRPDRDATLTRLHRVTAPRMPRDELFVFAFDHRTAVLRAGAGGRRRRVAAARLK